MECKICNKTFGSLSGLHGHLSKTHKCDQESYYHLYFPRRDLGDGELIAYKNYTQYFSSDFHNRESFADWLFDNYKEEKAREYCITKVKCVTVLPGTACLKSLMIPSIFGFEKMYGSIDKFLEALDLVGIQPKFDYKTLPIFKEGELKVFQDTREQLPLNLNCDTEVMKISVGDYVAAADFYAGVAIERKSLNDLAGTLGKGKERFIKELERAKELDTYIVILVEASHSDINYYSSSSSFSRKVNGQYLYHQIRELSANYDCQFVMSGSRTRAADLVEKIFRLGDQAKYMDIEYLKDSGRI